MNIPCSVRGMWRLSAAYLCALTLLSACELETLTADAGALDGGNDAGSEPETCDADHFDHDGDPTTACLEYTRCRPGQYVSTQPTDNTDRACSACRSGSFSAEDNAAECTNWTTCAAGSFVANTPSRTTDRTCSSCIDGTLSATHPTRAQRAPQP